MSGVSLHHGEVGLVRDRVEVDAEGRRVGDDVFQRLQLGDVVPRLLRHAQAGVVGLLLGRLVLVDGPPDGVLAPVVRREREVPVAVHGVQLGEVVEGSVGGVDDVAPPVVPGVLLELEAPAGARNELPDARGMRAGVRHRVEGALHHRQQRELHRHAAAARFPRRCGTGRACCASRMRCRYSGRAAYCLVFCLTSGPVRSLIANPARTRTHRSSGSAGGLITVTAGVFGGASAARFAASGTGFAATGGGVGLAAGGVGFATDGTGGTGGGGAGTATGSGAGAGSCTGADTHACSSSASSGSSRFKTCSSTRGWRRTRAQDQKRACPGTC